ncbi:unnamed protein product, partial [Phaeothamnion confervicola]
MWERESSVEDRRFLANRGLRYDLMVLDEGHSIKNANGQRYQQLQRVQSRRRLLLSGTPVQNNLRELLALLSFLMPKLFRQDTIETLLEMLPSGSDGAGGGQRQSSAASSSLLVYGDVRAMLAPFVLRRLKANVLAQMAPKTTATERLLLGPDQRRKYDAILARHLAGWSDYDLHQLCATYPRLSELCLPQEALFDSAKMCRLRDLLPELVRDGHRMLLFSQWTRVLDILEVFLKDVLGMRYCRLDGNTSVADRKEIIDGFSADPTIPVFLLSTRAGGLGINLTAADTVILHDVDFNPENDRQAEDRCHRIGQTKPVRVVKLVAADTVDEGIYRCGEQKRLLNKAVLHD